jgi:tetratricopeptide (TPR) repeat protein
MKLYKCKAQNPDYSDSYSLDINGSIIEKKSNPIDPKNNKNIPNKAPLDFAPGDAFGKRYLIMEEIRQEDFGKIYRAIDKEQKKIVTLRIFSPELSENGWLKITQKLKKKQKTGKSRFSKNENQDNIAKLYDLGKVGNTKFISTQCLDDKNPYKLSKRYKKLILSFSISIVLLIGLVVFLALTNMKSINTEAMGTAKKSIAVMYFKNNTGDEKLDHWREALSDLLITDLAQSKYLRVLSEKKLFFILKQLNQLDSKEYPLEVLQDVAKKGKVEYILLGSFNKAGNQYRIDIKLQHAKTGEIIGSETAQGKGEESIFTSVDELTKRIKNNFEFSQELMANDIDRNVGKITTNSPEAYKYYCQGRKYNAMGDSSQCLEYMKKAVAIDPEFAMAYLGIASAYYNMGYDVKNKEYLQKALKLADRLPDKEHYHIQANAYIQSEKTWIKAIDSYKKLLILYPDDVAAYNNLGILYWFLEEWDAAIEKFQIGIANKKDWAILYANQAYAFMGNGQYDRAEQILNYYITNFSINADINRALAYDYICQGKYELSLIEADKAYSLSPNQFENFTLKGDINLLRGNFSAAEEEYNKLLELKEPIAHLEGRIGSATLALLQGKFEKAENHYKNGIKESQTIGEKEWETTLHLFLASLYLKLGKAQKALEKSDDAWKGAIEIDTLSLKKFSLYYKTLAYIEMKELNKAAETAAKLKEQIGMIANKKHMRYYYYLIGMMELKRNNFSKAIKYFERAYSLLPSQHIANWIILHDRHALFLNSLASCYYQQGDLEKAQNEYNKITSLTIGRYMYGDVYAKSYYMLGKIYQQKNWKGKAIDNYQTFLDLWKDADRNIPEIIDAKKQLASLQST